MHQVVLHITLGEYAKCLTYLYIIPCVSILCLSSDAMLIAHFPCVVLHSRNTSCIGCGHPKSAPISGSQQINRPHQIYSSSNNAMSRTSASPRFSNLPNRTLSARAGLSMNQPAYSTTVSQSQSSRVGYQHEVSGPLKSAHPLLTPSGRAFAIGGKVQNVSTDPLSPCVMYWPDNEPFPEQGQIRPGSLVGIPVCLVPHGRRLILTVRVPSNRPSSTREIRDPSHM